MSKQNVFKFDLRVIRSMYNETQAKLAKRCGKTQSFIAKCESVYDSSRNITLKDLDDIERAYGINVEIIITDKNGNKFAIE